MSPEFNTRESDPVVDVQLKKLKNKAFHFLPIFIITFVIVISLMNSFYTLESKENGVVLRLGQLLKVETAGGLHLKMPFVDDVRKVNVRNVYNMEYGFRVAQQGTETSQPIYESNVEESTVIVDAANNNASIALIELIIQYQITNPTDYLFKVDDLEGTLRLALEDIIRTTLQSFTLDEAKTQKELIDKKILPALQKKMDEYEAGIQITLVGTQNFKFSANVEEAYQQKENANQYKNGKQEDAQKYNNTVLPQANASATKLIEEANAYKAETIANANANVAEFNALYTEYKNNPAILREKYYIEAMTAFLSQNKIVIDGTSSGSIYKFYNFAENDVVKEQVTTPSVVAPQ